MPSDYGEPPTDRSLGGDAERWNARYADAQIVSSVSPPELLSSPQGHSSAGDTALDVACGLGDAGLFLAQNGAEVTFIDVSPIALDIVEQRAAAMQLDVTTIAVDLRNEPPPTGPFDVISCAHYLNRGLLSTLGSHLTVGGRLIAAIATTKNLERHSRPSARFLLNPGELATLVPDLHVTHHDERWRSNGVHEAWLIAERRG